MNHFNEQHIKIKWNIENIPDVYYEVNLYRYFGFDQTSKIRKNSKITVYSRGDLVHRHYLTPTQIENLLIAIEQINIKFNEVNQLEIRTSYSDFRLRIKSWNFNLDYKWTDEGGIPGNNSLFLSLTNVIEVLNKLYPCNYNQLGVELR